MSTIVTLSTGWYRITVGETAHDFRIGKALRTDKRTVSGQSVQQRSLKGRVVPLRKRATMKDAIVNPITGKLLTPVEVVEMIHAAGPERAMADYSLANNRCACCSRSLKADDSLELGIGPVCRDGLESAGLLKGYAEAFHALKNDLRNEVPLDWSDAISLADYKEMTDRARVIYDRNRSLLGLAAMNTYEDAYAV